MKRLFALCGALLVSSTAHGQRAVTSSCIEHIPKGAKRPDLEAEFPERGLAGYEARLVVKLTHGVGATVLQSASDTRATEAQRALRAAGFMLPHADGGSPVTMESEKKDDSTRITTLSLPFVPLPDKPGQHEMTLPPIPIAVSRASGEVMTLCTDPLVIVVGDPIADEDNPKVRGNPAPRSQREEWTLAKQIALAIVLALALTALLTLLIMRYRARPKAPPPKRTVLPWVEALNKLAQLNATPWLDEERFDDYYDGVSAILRDYLGKRYGFDGLECTNAEMRETLNRVYPPPDNLAEIFVFLEDLLFMKFAEVAPQRADCEDAFGKAKEIVQQTQPRQQGVQERAA